MWEIAQEFQALLVFAEHRYYGESMPYGNSSFANQSRLGYLTSQQALADYVDLITFLKQSNGTQKEHQHRHQKSHKSSDARLAADRGNRSSSNPTIAFGGSYGGMLAAWFRLKYPAVIEGLVGLSYHWYCFSSVPTPICVRFLWSEAILISYSCRTSMIKNNFDQYRDIKKPARTKSRNNIVRVTVFMLCFGFFFTEP